MTDAPLRALTTTDRYSSRDWMKRTTGHGVDRKRLHVDYKSERKSFVAEGKGQSGMEKRC